MAYNKIFLAVHPLAIQKVSDMLTWPPASLATSFFSFLFFFDYVILLAKYLVQQVQYSQFNDCQYSYCRYRLVSYLVTW